jgi:preprotein translocase subunit SecA
MLKNLIKKLKPGYVQTDISEYYPTLKAVRIQEAYLSKLSDNDLQDLSESHRVKCSQNPIIDSTLVEIFALVSEVSSRKLGMRPFDVQILGALAMNDGKVIEMNTGEGKTLVATMPACLNAITGNRVHVLTFNDYLAKRDAQWMSDIYDFLGLSVGYIKGDMNEEERRTSYKNDITYLTAKQGGFDYLRSLLANKSEDIIIPEVGFAIIDEVDSILIDEARTPLVIAGKLSGENDIDLHHLSSVIKELKKGSDWQTDEYQLNIFLTDDGLKSVENRLGISNLYAPGNEELMTRIHQALHAVYLLHKDIDYIVRRKKIELVDEFTGRVVEDRKWPHGLQAAIEAKENIPIQEEGKILGKTTLQHFIKRYSRFCGMTGTAVPSAEEFFEIYNSSVTEIPPNKPCIRNDHEDLIFADKKSKYKALVAEILKEHKRGRPVLVGTSSVEESVEISTLIESESIPCQTLNAKNDEEEAKIVAKAGMQGAVTISTNMAGRGTDIKLGGEEGFERDRIIELGGLYVISTNRFESIRIDDQLRGRSGRQGDPGESRFFISLEDELLQRHGINELIPKRYRNRKDMSSVNSEIIKREVNRTQRIVEGKNLDIRKTLIKYASVVEMQRQIIHQKRLLLLDGESESLIESKDPEFFSKLIEEHGNELVKKVEKQVSLPIIDKKWADYIEETDRVREGIHWVTRAGLNPYYEFQKMMIESFANLQINIEQEILIVLKRVRITESGVDLRKEGLESPSSTWTYLISDNPFGDRLEILLGGNVGFGAIAALVNWPLLIIYFTIKKIFGKKGGT